MSDETPSEESPEGRGARPRGSGRRRNTARRGSACCRSTHGRRHDARRTPRRRGRPRARRTRSGPRRRRLGAGSGTPARKGVFVPAWAGAIVLVLVVAAIGFGVGRWTADDSTSNSAAIANNGGIVPQLPIGNGNNGNGNTGNGNNGGQTTPQTPTTPATGTAFLGVATQNGTDGVQVITVGANSPAAKAGLKEGDVITAIDNTSITTTTALRSAIQSHQSGDTVTVHYTRDGQATTVKVTLSTQSQ